MTLANEFNKCAHINQADFEVFLKLLYPFAPHLCEELWATLGHDNDMTYASWPSYDDDKLVESTINIAVMINGKVRDNVTIELDQAKDTVLEKAKSLEKIVPYLEGKTIKKAIYVPNKLVNFVV
jgi:leucyl-tRNA synthetase